MNALYVKTNSIMEERKMKKSNLLTKYYEKIKLRISNKIGYIWTKKQLEGRKQQIFDHCSHPSVLFFEEDCAFRCVKCNELLVKLAGKDEFKIFCELSEIDPKSLIV